jgi:hypothetical protein
VITDVFEISHRAYSALPARELRMTGDAFGHRKAAKNVVILYDILKGWPGALSA